MKLLKIVGVTSMLMMMAFHANANERVKDRIRSLAEDITYEVDYTMSSTQDLREARKLMRQALNLVTGRGHGPGDDPGYGEYTCVSRDNDGGSPYSLAVKRNFNVTKVNGVIFSSTQDCYRSVQNIKSFNRGSTSWICASRDADGSNPYAVYSLSGSGADKMKLIYSDYSSCMKAVNDARQSGPSIGICSTRDADGGNPWSLYVYNTRSQSLRKNAESYGSYAQCARSM